MADFTGVTTSNAPMVVNGGKEKIQEIVDSYLFFPDSDSVTCKVNEDGKLTIRGFDWFEVREDGRDYDVCTFEFLEKIQPCLAEDLILQMIGSVDDRFPLSALEIVVPAGSGEIVEKDLFTCTTKSTGTQDKKDTDGELVKYTNFYECSECGIKWQDAWSCMCNDRCPKCDAETEPYKSEEIE